MKPWEETWPRRLAAAAPEMARLLLELEWVPHEEGTYCPTCQAFEGRGHRDDCRLVAVLRKAGCRE